MKGLNQTAIINLALFASWLLYVSFFFFVLHKVDEINAETDRNVVSVIDTLDRYQQTSERIVDEVYQTRREFELTKILYRRAERMFLSACFSEPPEPTHSSIGVMASVMVPEEDIVLPDYLSRTQAHILKLAVEVGYEDDLDLTLMGIAMQESLAGVMGPIGDHQLAPGNRSYGVMQIRVPTVHHVLQHTPNIGYSFDSDEEIRQRLINDPRFSMEIAKAHLLWLKSQGLSWREMVTAYNAGLTGMRRMNNPEQFIYVRRVAERITQGRVAKYHRSLGLVD